MDNHCNLLFRPIQVCSVPLSGKDLEKRTEKELGRWRKDKPSSTFDPRTRCYGYRMVSARTRHQKEEHERKERETSNLSVPLARSASTLSLSPSLLHKRFRKGGKVNAGEWESGNKISRHLSMGAKEDWKSWSNVDFKKVQGVQEEEAVFDGQKTETEMKLAEENELEENKSTPTEHKEDTVNVEEQTEPLEEGISEKEENKEIGESKAVLEKTQDSQSVENDSQTAKESYKCEEKEKLDNPDQPEVLDEQNHKSYEENAAADANETKNQKDLQNVNQSYVLQEESNKTNEEESGDTGKNEEAENSEKLQNTDQSHFLEEQSDEQESEATDKHEEAENPAGENNYTTPTEEVHTEIQRENTDANTVSQPQVHAQQQEPAGMKPEASTETENLQQLQLDAASEVSETRSETNMESKSRRELDPKTDTHQEQEEVITEMQEKCHSTESFSETEHAESHAQTETETHVLAENVAVKDELNVEITQTDPEEQAEEDSEISSAPDCTLQEEETEITTVITETVEAVTDSPAEPIEEIAVPVHVETQNQERVPNPKCSQELQIYNEIDEEAAECASPAEKEKILIQDELLNLKEEPDQTQIITSDLQTPEESASGVVEAAERTENVEESKAADDNDLNSSESTSKPNPDSNTEIQDKVYQDTKDLPELSDSSQEQTAVRRSSRSSGDFRLQKSSSSRGSKVTRRLSEDLFSGPEKTNQSQFAAGQPELQPEEEKSEETVPEGAYDAGPRQEQQPDTTKRFGLFRKLKVEQPKKDKPKKKPKVQVPKILIQDFSDVTAAYEPAQEDVEENLSSRERRRRRREQERKQKEEEKMKKKKEKQQERERRKPQTRGKSFQGQKETVSDDVAHPAKTGSQITKKSASYAEHYF